MKAVDTIGAVQAPERSWFVVVMLAGVYALTFLDRQSLSILAEPIKNDLALSDRHNTGTARAPSLAISGAHEDLH